MRFHWRIALLAERDLTWLGAAHQFPRTGLLLCTAMHVENIAVNLVNERGESLCLDLFLQYFALYLLWWYTR